ncbi:Apc15p protein-domain-containing protein [Paecilomyces variotii]|uniref:Apc15p protein-domain-containing protein n=1 Tax=Byssochlamys spectabilis TaxID=264951 RepID=A0A443HTF9_BYSSP|nr:Apc15p protein-domain-containing protein [Paecilomyces variotii]KAJ9358557.1 hypothetical protein DTO280E4_5113 [Paecilomyces variotii]KAJ9396335.1 hypothetical protein DTO282F9_6770 [Paecilomyces variotii]RWQ95060.1 Apc15p protein-domain-containing protein [Paecilomyces variotii]
MFSLPLITPRDSHELWFGSSQTPPHRSSASQNQLNPSDPHQSSSRRYHQGNGHLPSGRTLISSTAPSNTLAALQLEERALRARKQNIASFGYAWIKPAGCAKTMLGMREEEAEREEGLLAAAAEMAGAGGDLSTMGIVDEFGRPQGQEGDNTGGVDDQMLERDLDDDIPDADADGLVEEGEEGLEEDEDGEEGLMERDLDDDIPEAFPEDDDDDDDEEEEEENEEEDDDFDNQPDLDDDIPAAEDEGGSLMVRDLDDDIPEAEEGSEQGEEWQHTDTEAEDDDDDDDDEHDPFSEQLFRTSTSSGRGLPPQPPPIRRETEAQRRFLNRWSGGADAFDTSGMTLEDEEDLRASIASQTSRRNSAYRRRFTRQRGGPRDSLE